MYSYLYRDFIVLPFFPDQRFHVKHFVLPVFYLKEKGAWKTTPSVQDFSPCLSDCQFQICLLLRFSLFSTVPISYWTHWELTHLPNLGRRWTWKYSCSMLFLSCTKCEYSSLMYSIHRDSNWNNVRFSILKVLNHHWLLRILMISFSNYLLTFFKCKLSLLCQVGFCNSKRM